jgi:hypothetical protein
VRERERSQEFWVELLGRALPTVNTDERVRALDTEAGVEVFEEANLKADLAIFVISRTEA